MPVTLWQSLRSSDHLVTGIPTGVDCDVTLSLESDWADVHLLYHLNHIPPLNFRFKVYIFRTAMLLLLPLVPTPSSTVSASF